MLQQRKVDAQTRWREAVLNPVDRCSEIIFGAIMALTFTGTLSVATAGDTEVRTMLASAIGCNLAWGIVDAVIFVLVALTQRSRAITLWQALQKAADARTANDHLRGEVSPEIADALGEDGIDHLRIRLQQAPPPPREGLHIGDLRSALGVFLLVFLSTIPLILPFLFIDAPQHALRVSNAVAVVMLFTVGYQLGRYAGWRPWYAGFGMAALGTVLVLVTIALGG